MNRFAAMNIDEFRSIFTADMSSVDHDVE